MKSKEVSIFLSALALSVSLVSFAEGDRVTLYGDWMQSAYTWKNAAGDAVEWTDGAIAEVTATCNRSTSPKSGAEIAPYKLVFNTPSYYEYFWNEGSGKVSIGAGGLEFKTPGVFSYGLKNRDPANSLVRLMADQTWRGPDAASGYTRHSDAIIGSIYFYKDIYSLMPLYVAPDVHNWTITGMLNVWITSQYNDLSELDIRVESPARLYVPETYWVANVQRDPAKLRARRLTLSGDGDQMLPIGASLPYVHPTALPVDKPDVEMTVLLDGVRLAQTLELNDGADLTALKPAVFDIPNWIVSGTGESVVTGEFSFASSAPSVALEDGAVLHMAGAFEEAAVDSVFSATGTGVLAISGSTEWNLSGGVSVSEGVTLSIRGLARFDIPVSGAGSLLVTPGEDGMTYVTPEALSEWTGGKITVDGGTLVLDEELPEGVTLETLDGASVVYGGSDESIVTDIIRTETSIEVPAGGTLHVFGDGLTAATTLKLNRESKLLFHDSATVGSPVTCASGESGNVSFVYLYAKHVSVTGTVSGRITGGATHSYIVNDSPGCILFAGGGELFAESYIIAYDGSFVFTSGEYLVGNTSRIGLNSNSAYSYSPYWGRYIGIRDGGKVKIARSSSSSRVVMYATPCKDAGNYAASATIEVGPGGELDIPDRAVIYLGGRQNCGEFVISGGTVTMGKDGGLILGNDNLCTGTFRMTAGTFKTSSPFKLGHTAAHGLVYLEGGVIGIGSGFNAEALMTGGLCADGETRNFSVGILGDCTLDLSDAPVQVITNMPATSNRGEWYGNGTLTVKGGKTLYMRSMPNNLNLKLEGDGTRIETGGDTRVFDAEACAEYCKWRRPYINGVNDYYNSAECGLEVEGILSFGTLQLADGAPSFVNGTAGSKTSVPEVQVLESGCWDNETSIVSGDCEITNITFSAGSTWRVTRKGADTAVRGFIGSVSLPAAMFYEAVGTPINPRDVPLIVSGTVMADDTVWTRAGSGPCAARPRITRDGTGICLAAPGACICIR